MSHTYNILMPRIKERLRSRGGRVPLAWRNVTAQPKKFVLSVAGVTFAVLLMFTEVGFLNGVLDGQVILLGKLRADVVLVSASKANMFAVEPFPRERLHAALAVPAVESVSPVYVAMNVSWNFCRVNASPSVAL